jgi:hypothetical protein
MANRVRAHPRKTAGGGTTRVRQHSRAGGPSAPKKQLVSPRHAWDLFKRAFRAHKRGKKGLALTLGLLGAGELGAFLTLRGGAVILVTAGVLAVGTGAVLGQMAGLH